MVVGGVEWIGEVGGAVGQLVYGGEGRRMDSEISTSPSQVMYCIDKTRKKECSPTLVPSSQFFFFNTEMTG